MKQCAVAERAGFTPNELSQILNDRKLLRVEHVNPIAQALGVEPNDIYGLDAKANASYATGGQRSG